MKNNYKNVYTAAVEALELKDNSPRLVSAEFVNGFWELKIRTLVMVYDLIVDAASRELVGINFEPAVDAETVYTYTPELFAKAA